MDEARIKAIQERVAKATPGPWYAYEGQVMIKPLEHGFGPLLGDFCTDLGRHGKVGPRRDRDYADASFAAHARTDIPDLLAELAALRDQVLQAEIVANKAMDERDNALERAEKAEAALQVAMDVADKEKQRGDNLKEKLEKAEAIIAQHDLCHNLHGKVDAQAFAAGCAAEQRKLYGCAPDADQARINCETVELLHPKLLAAESDAARLREVLETAMLTIRAIEPASVVVGMCAAALRPAEQPPKTVHRGMGSDLMALCGAVDGASGHDQVKLTYRDEQVTCPSCRREMKQAREPSVCPRCDGTGHYSSLGEPSRECAVCNGSGKISDEQPPQPSEPSTCPRCEGTGRYSSLGEPSRDCAVCNGTGKITEALLLADLAKREAKP